MASHSVVSVLGVPLKGKFGLFFTFRVFAENASLSSKKSTLKGSDSLWEQERQKNSFENERRFAPLSDDVTCSVKSPAKLSDFLEILACAVVRYLWCLRLSSVPCEMSDSVSGWRIRKLRPYRFQPRKPTESEKTVGSDSPGYGLTLALHQLQRHHLHWLRGLEVSMSCVREAARGGGATARSVRRWTGKWTVPAARKWVVPRR